MAESGPGENERQLRCLVAAKRLRLSADFVVLGANSEFDCYPEPKKKKGPDGDPLSFLARPERLTRAYGPRPFGAPSAS